MLAATDTGYCDQIVPGLSLHEKRQALTDVGIPPMKAIQGATLWAAELIGQQKNLGSVEPGSSPISPSLKATRWPTSPPQEACAW